MRVAGGCASTMPIGDGMSRSPRASWMRRLQRLPEDRMSEAKWRRYARLTGPKLGADIYEEIEFHLQILTDRNIALGMDHDAARAKAILEFGDLAKARDEMMKIGTS